MTSRADAFRPQGQSSNVLPLPQARQRLPLFALMLLSRLSYMSSAESSGLPRQICTSRLPVSASHLSWSVTRGHAIPLKHGAAPQAAQASCGWDHANQPLRFPVLWHLGTNFTIDSTKPQIKAAYRHPVLRLCNAVLALSWRSLLWGALGTLTSLLFKLFALSTARLVIVTCQHPSFCCRVGCL